MRYAPEHKQQTRERILRAAGRQFREQGFADTSVASVMKEAELTHGGFYAHFKSKDELIAAVIESGFDQVSERFESQFDHLSGNEWLAAWVTGYLSSEHQAQVGGGCPLPALSSEIARGGGRARAAFTEIFEQRLARLSRRVEVDSPEAERRVLAAIAQMAGALLLSRALDEPLAGRVREAAGKAALSTLTVGSPRSTETGGSA